MAAKKKSPPAPEAPKPKPKKQYRANNVIDYISIRTGEYVRVKHGDVFDDMNSVAVRNELDHGNIEVYEGGEN